MRMPFGINKLIRRYRRDRDGVVAVEFALIAAPFFMLLIGMIETGFFFAASVSLEGGTQAAARLVMTGQAQGSADPEDVFAQRLCDQVNVIINCDRLQYEVIDVGDGGFSSVSDVEPEFDDEGNLVPRAFDAGGSESVVLIRTVYRYRFMTPYLGELMQDGIGNGDALLMATVVIQNEPYDFGVN